jgi:hypothetical protein
MRTTAWADAQAAAPAPSALEEHEPLLAALAELQAVLVEGGLSAEMRARGADAAAGARAAIAATIAEGAFWRARAEEADARLSAAVNALTGASPARSSRVGSGLLGRSGGAMTASGVVTPPPSEDLGGRVSE